MAVKGIELTPICIDMQREGKLRDSKPRPDLCAQAVPAMHIIHPTSDPHSLWHKGYPVIKARQNQDATNAIWLRLKVFSLALSNERALLQCLP